MAETAQQAERRRQAQAIERREEEMVNLHLDSFPEAQEPRAKAAEPVDGEALRERFAADAGLPELERQLEPFGTPPQAPGAEPVDHKMVIADCRKRTLREVPLIRFAERRQAKEEALVAAETAIAAEEEKRAANVTSEQSRLDRIWGEVQRVRGEVEKKTKAEAERERAARAEREREEQAVLDREWSQLLGNDPATVEKQLCATLTDWARSRAGEILLVTSQGSEALVTLLVDQPERIVPQQRADFTAAGRPTVKKRNQTDRNQLYFSTLASAVLALARYTLARAPGLDRAGVLVVRQEAAGPMAGQLVAIYFGRFERDAPALSSHYPADAAESASDARLNIKGRTDEVAALDLTDEPHLQQALERARQALRIPTGATGRK